MANVTLKLSSWPLSVRNLLLWRELNLQKIGFSTGLDQHTCKRCASFYCVCAPTQVVVTHGVLEPEPVQSKKPKWTGAKVNEEKRSVWD
jgi:hypothetical protein